MLAQAAHAAARACGQATRSHAIAVRAAGGAPAPSLQALVERVNAASTPAPSPSTSALSADQPFEWEAVRVGRDGSATAVRLSASSLGLAPRDAGLFSRAASGGGPGAQRATLVTRQVRISGPGGAGTPHHHHHHRGLILLRTEAVRAAIGASEAFIFPCRRERDTEAVLGGVREAVRAAAAATSTPTPTPAPAPAPAPAPPSSSSSRLPFELAVLEACLAETVRQFERRHRQLRLVADGVADDVRRALRGGQGGGSAGGSTAAAATSIFSATAAHPPEVGRLLPIAIALQEVRHDVREAAAAVAEVADSDAAIAAVCLSDHAAAAAASGEATPPSPSTPPPHAHVAAAVLESYERQIETVSSAIRELEENTASLNAALAMGLDAHRNALMSLNAHMTILTASIAACALPAAWFGMNLASGLEGAAGVFWPVVCWSAAGAAGLGGAVLLGWRKWPRAAAAARASDQQALRDLLLYHMDDMEDVLAAVTDAAAQAPGGTGSLSRGAFHAAVTGALGRGGGGGGGGSGGGGRPIAADELDLLFRVYDLDRDGFVRTGELATAAVGGGGGGRGGAKPL